MNDSNSDIFLSDESPRPAGGYCLRCGEMLHPPTMSQCPRCELQFNPDDPQTYAADRERFHLLKCWLPGFCLSVVVGVGSYAVLMLMGEMSAALFVAVPMAFGALLGYTVRVKTVWHIVLAAIAVMTVAGAVVMGNLAGLFCGFTLSIIFLFPAMFGVGLGALLRAWMDQSRFAQRHYLPVLLIVISPFGVQAVDGLFPHPIDIATVQTELVLPASASGTWNSLMFYEEVDHEPPWLLKLTLPRPVRAEGSMGQVGDTRRCIYENGHLTKQIIERVERRRLAFKVIEQHLHFERDVTLLDGSFQLQPLDPMKTRITLTTRYIRHLRPAWLWKPIESKVVHTLHRHVLEGVRRKADRPEENPLRKQNSPEYERPSESRKSELRLAATNGGVAQVACQPGQPKAARGGSFHSAQLNIDRFSLFILTGRRQSPVDHLLHQPGTGRSEGSSLHGDGPVFPVNLLQLRRPGFKNLGDPVQSVSYP